MNFSYFKSPRTSQVGPEDTRADIAEIEEEIWFAPAYETFSSVIARPSLLVAVVQAWVNTLVNVGAGQSSAPISGHTRAGIAPDRVRACACPIRALRSPVGGALVDVHASFLVWVFWVKKAFWAFARVRIIFTSWIEQASHPHRVAARVVAAHAMIDEFASVWIR